MSRSRLLLAVSVLLATGFTLIAVAHAPARGLTSAHDHASHRHVVGGVDPTPVAVGGRAAIEAAFQFESYRPGETARLRVWTRLPSGASLQVFQVGRKRYSGELGPDEMRGTPVASARRISAGRAARTIALRIGDWPTGLYFVQLTSPGRIGFAPFIVAPQRLGENRAAVVLPTRTWQAYNARDDDGDGRRGHLVRAPEHNDVRARPAVSEPRRAAALPHLRSRLPPLAPRHGSRRRRARPGGSRRDDRPPNSTPPTSCSSFRATTSTSPKRSTTPSPGSATAAGTSCSSPRTTSSGASTCRRA